MATNVPLGQSPPFLKYEGNKNMRITFLCICQVLYLTLGAIFYSFPMWLNQIIAEVVPLSRFSITFLGGIVYTSLGIVGALLLVFNSLLKEENGGRFKIVFLSFLGSAFTGGGWLILYLLHITGDGQHTLFHNAVVVGFAMSCLAFGCGIFFMWLLGICLSLIHEEWQFIYVASTNALFSLGAMTALGMKLHMGATVWMFVMLCYTLVVLLVLFVFIVMLHDRVWVHLPPPTAQQQPEQENAPDGIPPPQQEAVAVAEVALSANPVHQALDGVKDLLLWRRSSSDLTLQQQQSGPASVCDVTSIQFYFMLLSQMTIAALATTFMSNLGNIISSHDSVNDDGDDEDDGESRAQVIVLIWSSLGQTIGRTLVALVQFGVSKYTKEEPDAVGENTAASLLANEHLAEQRERETGGMLAAQERSDNANWQSKIRNRSLPTLTCFIAALFFCGLFFLRFFPKELSFTLSSSIISGGYGMMWCVSTSYPQFLLPYDFGTILAVFQVFGAIGTLLSTLSVSFFCQSNDSVFTVLFVGAAISMVIPLLLLWSRLCTEVTV